LLVVAAITRYTLLELVPRKMLHELGKHRLANIHPSLSAIAKSGDRQMSEATFA
jgi:hypothetical protein